MIDREWEDGDDSAMVDEALAEVIQKLVLAQADDQKALDRLMARYENGGMYSMDDSSEQDYLEGKIAGLEHALILLKGGSYGE